MHVVAAEHEAQPFLAIRDVTVRFGGIAALDGVSLDMGEGEILGLIGPNGAGKTTLFNCLSRLYTPSAGAIVFCGHDLLRTAATRIARFGIGRTFQNVAAFASLSVLDNIRIGAHTRFRGNLLADMLQLPGSRRTERAIDAIARELVDDLRLGAVALKQVKGLPFGIQKRVELARALAAEPKLLLLDEPAAGLNHEEVAELAALIREIRDVRRIGVLLVEHHMGLVMSISDKVVVLNFGRKIAEGAPGAVQSDPLVIDAYLGGAR